MTRGCLRQLVLAILLATALFWGTVFWFHGPMLLSLFRGEPSGMQQTLDVLHERIFASCRDAYTPSFDASKTFAWAEGLRLEWEHIRAELHAWERDFGAVPAFTDLDEMQLVQAPHRQWSSLWLKMYGTDTAAARYFPRTMAALGRTTASTAMFSIMQPGKGLAQHRGDFKAVLRYHLALEVPPPPPGKSEADEPLRLMVAEKLFYPNPKEKPQFTAHSWREGEHLLFDDTFIHYVENRRSTARRVVLFVDVPREDCGIVVNTLFKLAVNHVVKHVPRVSNIIANANAFMAEAVKDAEQREDGRHDGEL